jgi:hypothetical protein
MEEPAEASATRTKGCAAVLGLLLLGGCFSAAPDPTATPPGLGDCLKQVELKRLRRALERCNEVVEAHPKAPQPLNERALLHSLAGDTTAACRDSQAAAQRLKALPASPEPDPLLVKEINMREKNCRELTTAPATAAPVGKTDGA